MRNPVMRLLGAVLAFAVFFAPHAEARQAEGADVPTLSAAAGESAQAGSTTEAGEGRVSTAIEIAVVLTVLSLLPAVLITITSFTRIVILLSFVRRALSVNELPPNPVLIGLALFLTLFVMAPVGERIWTHAWVPYEKGEASA